MTNIEICKERLNMSSISIIPALCLRTALVHGLSIESMELVLGPLSFPTVGTIFAGCSHRTNSLSSVKLECSE